MRAGSEGAKYCAESLNALPNSPHHSEVGPSLLLTCWLRKLEFRKVQSLTGEVAELGPEPSSC